MEIEERERKVVFAVSAVLGVPTAGASILMNPGLLIYHWAKSGRFADRDGAMKDLAEEFPVLKLLVPWHD
jgi:hypothetical protein